MMARHLCPRKQSLYATGYQVNSAWPSLCRNNELHDTKGVKLAPG